MTAAGRPGPPADRSVNFDKLGDAEKVKFVSAENADMLAHLDKLLTEFDALGAGVDDPDGLVSVSLGYDGHLIEIRIADGIGEVMTNLELEERLYRLFAAGTEGIAEMRAQFWTDAIQNRD